MTEEDAKGYLAQMVTIIALTERAGRSQDRAIVELAEAVEVIAGAVAELLNEKIQPVDLTRLAEGWE
jgi:hypothetical protein